MRTFEATTVVGISAEEVFGHITDFDGVGRWMPGAEAKVTSAGPLGVGSVVEIGGRGETTYAFEVTAYEPPRLCALRADTEAGPVVVMTFRLDPEGGGNTRLTYVYEVDWEGFVGAVSKGGRRPDEAKLEAAARKRLEGALDGLKRLAESGTSTPQAPEGGRR